MKVKVKVKAKKSWSIMNRNLVRDAVAFAIKEYDLYHYGKLTVKLCKHANFDGHALELHDGDFMVTVNASDDIVRVISTVFHELCHIKQFVHDGLELEHHKVMFKGDLWDIRVASCTHKEYEATPWEVEARKEEERLLKLYTT